MDVCPSLHPDDAMAKTNSVFGHKTTRVCVCVALYVWNIRQRIVYLDEAHYKAGDEVAVMVLL